MCHTQCTAINKQLIITKLLYRIIVLIARCLYCSNLSYCQMKILAKKGELGMANKIRTSKSVAKKASSQLRSKATTKATKSVAGSTLSNRRK